MREIALIEWSGPDDVSVLARSDDPELLELVTRDLAVLERRRLVRLERPLRLVPTREVGPEEPFNKGLDPAV